jgi:hypothetical protein
MGAVFRPKDMPAGWKKRVQESIKDFSPDIRDNIIKIIDSLGRYKIRRKTKRTLGS